MTEITARKYGGSLAYVYDRAGGYVLSVAESPLFDIAFDTIDAAIDWLGRHGYRLCRSVEEIDMGWTTDAAVVDPFDTSQRTFEGFAL